MRGLLKFLSVIFVALMFGSVGLFAQESTPRSGTELQELNSHPELNLNDDKTLISDQEVKPAKATQTRETSTAPATTNLKKSNSVDKKKEDPFSFNFLYFIIQKFKFSDIVDEETN